MTIAEIIGSELFFRVFIVVAACALIYATIDAERQDRRRVAWLSEHNCKRAAYHPDSVRGVWTCPDGQVYLLRDVPAN